MDLAVFSSVTNSRWLTIIHIMATLPEGCVQIQKSLISLSEIQKKYEDDLQQCESNLQQLQTQQIECQLVLQEVERLDPSRTLYKQIGGALITQDIDEAKLSIQKRIDFITGEMTKRQKKSQEIVDKIKENSSKMREHQENFTKLISTQ